MIVIDIETSGLDPVKHSILSIGAIDMNNPTNKFYGECQCEPGKVVDEKALRINGFSQGDLMNQNKITVKELLQDFIHWTEAISDKTLAGHNIGQFDLQFLNEVCRKYKLKSSWAHRIFDLHTLSYSHLVASGKEIPEPLNLDTILGIV